MLKVIASNEKASALALHALGLSLQDIRALRTTRIPIWSVILVSAVVGGVVAARYVPRTWIEGLREIGK